MSIMENQISGKAAYLQEKEKVSRLSILFEHYKYVKLPMIMMQIIWNDDSDDSWRRILIEPLSSNFMHEVVIVVIDYYSYCHYFSKIANIIILTVIIIIFNYSNYHHRLNFFCHKSFQHIFYNMLCSNQNSHCDNIFCK